MEWISIKEVCNLTNKSESTIRNLARKLKASNSKNIRLETLKTGHDKIMFKLSYVNSQMLIGKTVKNNVDKPVQNVDRFIQIMENQLNEKDKQIESLQQTLQAQNLMLHNLQESIKLIEAPKKKKRWFW
jgi:predicted RNase H-like nuclease (RuvC/YqgF family)